MTTHQTPLPGFTDLVQPQHLLAEALRGVFGEDFMCSEHMEDTPWRLERFWEEYRPDQDEDFVFTVFEGAYDDQIVVETNIPFYSLCAHHLLPFFGKAHIAYIPRKRKIAGLSKLARTLAHFAKRPQVQEQLGVQVAEYLSERLDPLGVAVILNAEHLCMTMRGAQAAGTITTTSVMKGAFFRNAAAREELLALIAQAAR